MVAGGALIGFSLGTFLLFNRAAFSVLVRISQFEATSYFMGVFMPTFIILIIIGYIFATAIGLKSSSLSALAPLYMLSLLCIALSALSVFYLISLAGGFLTLSAQLRVYTKPSFKSLSKKEAFFLLELGAIFVASFSTLFLLNWLISNFYQTYALGLYKSYSPYAFILIGALSLIAFFLTPLLSAKGGNIGVCATSSFVMSLFSILAAIQSQHVLLTASAYSAIFILIVGIASATVGDLIYARLLFSKLTIPTTANLTSTLLYEGKHCPYCGKPRFATFQTWCPHCGRNLMWTPSAPYCPSCGRVLPADARNCPHCLEDIEKKRVYFQQKEAKEQAIADKLLSESRKKSQSIKTE